MAAPSFVAASAIGDSLTGGNIVLTLPGHATDDVGLIVVWNRSISGTQHAVTDWTRLAQWDDTTQNDMWSVFGRRFTSGAETNPTITCDSGTGDSFAMCGVYRGCITTEVPWEVIGTPAFSATNPLTITGIVTLSAESLVVVLGGYGDNNATAVTVTGTDPAAYTEHYTESATGGDGSVFIAEAERSAAGATGNITADWGITLTGTADASGIAIALKPPAVVTTPAPPILRRDRRIVPLL